MPVWYRLVYCNEAGIWGALPELHSARLRPLRRRPFLLPTFTSAQCFPSVSSNTADLQELWSLLNLLLPLESAANGAALQQVDLDPALLDQPVGEVGTEETRTAGDQGFDFQT